MSQVIDPKAKEPAGITVPEKHFPKWLQTQSHITELRIWIGFAEFVLSLLAGVALIAYIAIKAPDALKYVLPLLSATGSLAGIAVGVHKYINRNKPNAD
jgi:hypothetical protein